MKIALVFPGQGSQVIGMGQDVYQHYTASREIFEIADQALGEDLSRLIFTGEKEELTKTVNAQPALVTTSIALLKALQEECKLDIACYAGHSLGEFSAYVAAGGLSFDVAVRLVRRRAELMTEAVPAGVGSMAAILGLNDDQVTIVCQEVAGNGQLVHLANVNCPGQIVISGTAEGVAAASALAKEQGAKRAIPLSVSGPFHSVLMMPAARQFADDLQEINFIKTTVPVYTNLTAEPAENVKLSLAQQLFSPVLWQKTIENMIASGVDCIIEVGPGTVLSGLTRKINPDIKTFSVFDQASCLQVADYFK